MCESGFQLSVKLQILLSSRIQGFPSSTPTISLPPHIPLCPPPLRKHYISLKNEFWGKGAKFPKTVNWNEKRGEGGCRKE